MKTQRIARWVAAGLAACLALVACSAVPEPRVEQPAVTEASPRASGAVNRIAVVESDGVVYTIDPGGADRADVNTTGNVPNAALVWSPDSSRVAFTLITTHRSELITADARGQNRQSIFSGAHADAPFYLYWSPDNTHVAFLKPDAQNGIALEIAPAEQAAADKPVTRGQPNYFSWSPQGDKLALHLGGPQGFIGTFAVGGDDVQRSKSEPALFQSPAWSPQGDTYLVARAGSSKSDELVVVSSDTEKAIATYDGRIAFAWSPDGTRIAYSTSIESRPDYSRLRIIDADGGNPRTLINENHFAFFWSPDGGRIAYLTGRLTSPGVVGRSGGLAAPRVDQTDGDLELMWHVVDVASGQATQLISFRPSDHFAFMMTYFDQYAQSITLWSPDSRYLLLAGRPLGHDSGIYRVDTTAPADAVTRVGPGEYAIWSWH